jgi:hypothetical protein
MSPEQMLIFLETFNGFKSTKSIFDFDLSDLSSADGKKNLLVCWFALMHKFYPDDEDAGTKIITNHVGEYVSVDEISKKGHGMAAVGTACSLLCNTINHACYSNVQKVLVNNQLIMYVTRPIKEGDQLFYNFE